MTLRLSTGLRNAMLGDSAPSIAIIAANTIALVDGGEGVADTITDSNEGFITAGFVVGDEVTVAGATASADDGTYTVTGVTAGTLTIPTGSFTTGQAAGTVVAVAAAKGGSLKDSLRNGRLVLYSGTQPTTADAAYNGTLLVVITVSSGEFTAGSEANALEFGDAASGAISKASGEVWSGVGETALAAGWFRFYANESDSGSLDATALRVDGSVGTSGADLNMSSTSITVGSTYTIDDFTLTLPHQYGA